MPGKMVILARHGTHDQVGRVLSGRSDIGLNGAGLREAAALAQGVVGQAIATIHSSPRRRTRETAAPIESATGIAAVVTAALDEIDFGLLTGRHFDELAVDAAWVRWNAERHEARCPGGETMAEAVDRARAYLDGLPESAFPALCVTHCDIIRGLVADLLGLRYDRLFSLGCDPGSLTTIVLDERRLVSLNAPAG